MAKNLVVANWKMNPVGSEEAKKIYSSVSRKSKKFTKLSLVFAPPFVFLPLLKKQKGLFLGAQNAHFEENGAFTGEISLKMLKAFKVDYVILGHSERRAMGEDNFLINKKIKSALKEKITPILCIGEPERDTHGAYLSFLRKQISECLQGISQANLKNIVLAYEPVWAIGKNAKDAMNPHVLHQTTLFIKKVLMEIYGKNFSTMPKIIYGGSVEPSNASDLMKEGNVSGFLVGHASLSEKTFIPILEVVQKS